MQKKYLALLHKIGLTHKNLFQIFTEKNGDFKIFFENLNFDTLKKYKIPENRILQILEYKNKLKTKEIFQKIDDL